MILNEIIHIGHDNAIRLLLLEDCVPFADRYPTVTPDRFVFTIDDITIDSEDHPTVFNWIAADSILEITAGSVVTEELANSSAELVVYSSLWPNGIVWVHPTSTQDQLIVRVTD